MSVTTERRPVTDAERAIATALASAERPRWTSILGTGAFLVVASAFITPLLAGSAIMLLDGLGLHVNGLTTVKIIATCAVLMLAWHGWLVFGLTTQRRRIVAAIESDLAEGIVEVLQVESTAARRPTNDVAWSPAFFHDVGEGRFLSTQGPHLKPFVAKGTFPCRSFSIVRLPTARITLELTPKGEAVVPTDYMRSLDTVRDGDIVMLP